MCVSRPVDFWSIFSVVCWQPMHGPGVGRDQRSSNMAIHFRIHTVIEHHKKRNYLIQSQNVEHPQTISNHFSNYDVLHFSCTHCNNELNCISSIWWNEKNILLDSWTMIIQKATISYLACYPVLLWVVTRATYIWCKWPTNIGGGDTNVENYSYLTTKNDVFRTYIYIK
jgi:hypothetical protein